jgi:hypothetical protein
MEIIFVSSLDASEEERLASVLLATVNAMLVDTPLAYTLRIRTSSQKLYQQSHAGVLTPGEQAPRSAASALHGSAAMKRS